MSDYKKEIINVLEELEGVWPLAFGFKKLITLTDNSEFTNLVRSVIFHSVKKAKLDINHEKILILRRKIEQIKKEESLDKYSEDFLEDNML